MTLSKMHACVVLLAFMPSCLSIDDCVDCVDGQAASFLQTGLRAQPARKEEKQCGHLIKGCMGDVLKMFNNNEICHLNKADFSRSIVDVMREHPGDDGFCYFNASAMYISYAGEAPDYWESCKGAVLGLRAMSAYKGPNTGQLVTFNWEGDSITTYADLPHYLYDDLYAFSLGFLQGQGINTSKMSDGKAWEEESRQQCEAIQAKYNFRDDELVFNDLLDMNMPIMAQCYCAAGVPLPLGMSRMPYITKRAEYKGPNDCKTVTKKEFARHHYMKCVLGHRNSADDMAYLHGRACLLPDNRIGHYAECPVELKGV